jgi:uncharacterized membrane protein YgdD (TMEM256/DUF423 family)
MRSSPTLPKSFVSIGLLGALAVALGALGAHFLKNLIPSGTMTLDLLDGFDKGVRYHFYHLLAMILVVLLERFFDSKFLRWAYRFFLWGIILFSGSLYFLCTRHVLGMEFLKVLGPVTPLGGICFIVGWLMLVVGVYRK